MSYKVKQKTGVNTFKELGNLVSNAEKLEIAKITPITEDISEIETDVFNLNNNKVSKTGDETISGKKKFSNGSGYIELGSNDTIDTTTVPVVKIEVTTGGGGLGYRTQKFQDKDGTIALDEDIPDKLPSPNVLTIKKDGEVIGTYDGSEAMTIDTYTPSEGTEIPLYDTTGQSTEGAMTQKATTDELQKTRLMNVTLYSSSSTSASYKINVPYEELTQEGAEFVIKFDRKPAYSGDVELVDTTNGVHHIYVPISNLEQTNNITNYKDLSSSDWQLGDLIRIKYVKNITSYGSTVNGFVAIENISNSYYYGTSKGVIADTTLSLSSGNAVQNRTVTTELNKKPNFEDFGEIEFTPNLQSQVNELETEIDNVKTNKAEITGSNIDKDQFNVNLQNDWVNKYQRLVSSATTTWTSVDLYDYFEQQDGLFEILLTTEMYNNASGSNKGFTMYTDCAGNETNYITLHYEWKYDTSRETCIVPVKRYIYFRTNLKTSGDYEVINACGYRRIK